MTNTNTAEVKTHKVVQVTPDLNKLATLFVDTFPQLSVDDQQLTLKLYQLLAEGKTVSRDRLAQALGRSTDTVIHLLTHREGFLEGEQERAIVLGYPGFAIFTRAEEVNEVTKACSNILS